MFRFLCSEKRLRSARFYLVSFFLCFCLAKAAFAQTQPSIVWQTDSGAGAVAYSADGQLLLAGTRLFNATTGQVIRNFVLPYNGGGVNTVGLSRDGQFAAIGIQSFNQNLDLFRVSDGVLIKGRITAHNNGTTSVDFSPNGQLLASGGRDGTAKLWHLPDMTLVQTLNGGVGYRPRVFAVAFSKDGQTLAVGGQGGILLFRVTDGAFLQQLNGAASILSLAFSPDNQFLSAGSDTIDQQGQCTDCTLKTWRISDGALLQTIDGNNNGVISIAYSPDQRIIAVGAGDRIYDGVVRFFRVSDGALLRFFYQSGAYVTNVRYSPNGSAFAFGRSDAHLTVARNPFPRRQESTR